MNAVLRLPLYIRKEALTELIYADHYVQISLGGITGYLMSVEREDGSGRSFNVKLATSKGPQVFHVRLAA